MRLVQVWQPVFAPAWNGSQWVMVPVGWVPMFVWVRV